MIPSLVEYETLKARYPSTFLFFRNRGGDGYWLLHEQAWIAAEVLDMPLTGYLVLSRASRASGATVRALSINSRAVGAIMEELKKLCFGMRTRLIDE